MTKARPAADAGHTRPSGSWKGGFPAFQLMRTVEGSAARRDNGRPMDRFVRDQWYVAAYSAEVGRG